MKQYIQLLTIIGLLISSCRGEEGKKTKIESDVQKEVTTLVGLVKDNKVKEIQRKIRPQKESKLLRHAISQEEVSRVFKGIDAAKIKFGKLLIYPERNLLIIRINEPVKLDLEYYYDPKNNAPLLLQSIHP